MAADHLSRQQRRAQERAARKRIRSIGHGALAVGALLAAGSASAATFNVSNLNDSGAGSLRDAVAQANGAAGADIITFQAGLTGTITLTTGQIAVTDSVSINGPGAAVITVSGNSSSGVFDVENIAATPTTVNINNLTLTAGNNPQGGAVRDAGENLTLDHVTISGSNATDGGGVYFDGSYGATLTVTGSTITGNTASDSGAGLALSGSGAVTISNTNVTNNTALNVGGGMYMSYMNGAVAITGSTISGNTASTGGGVSAGYADQPLTITNSTIANNTAGVYDGGGLQLIRTYSTVSLTNVTISGNQSADCGAGISADMYSGSQLTVANTVVQNNTAGTKTNDSSSGGGICFSGIGEGGTRPLLTITDSLISGNVADPASAGTTAGATTYDLGYGGGIYLSYVDATIKRTTIKDNKAFAGGGVYAYGYASATFENVTIAQNTGQTTVAPYGAGGGVLAAYGSTVTFHETTVTGNSATTFGGGIFDYAAAVTLDNTIVANNNATIDPDISGTVTADYTLIKTPGGATINSGTGNVTGSDPNLGPLAANSSTIVAGATGSTATPPTEMPLCPSPVINAGDPAFTAPPSTDERGFPRVAGGRIDMGAVEVQPSTLQFSTTAQSVAENGGSVTVAVTRSTPPDGPVAVSYNTANGTATAGADYTAASGQLTWADGDAANKTFNVTILDDVLFEGNETFTVSLSAPTCGATVGANALDTITIVDNDSGNADLSITKSATSPVFATQPMTYNIAVHNAGPFAAGSAVVTDVLPATVTLVSASASQGSCNGTTTITCSLGTIANGGNATITIVVKPTTAGPLANTASVSGAPQPDPNPTNNSATANVTVKAATEIPTYSEWMKILLTLAIAMLGFVRTRND